MIIYQRLKTDSCSHTPINCTHLTVPNSDCISRAARAFLFAKNAYNKKFSLKPRPLSLFEHIKNKFDYLVVTGFFDFQGRNWRIKIMISTTDILLSHLALELLRLRGVSIASGTFGDAIARIKLNPLQLPEAKQPLHANNKMPGNDMGFFIPIEPQENQDDSLFVMVQAFLWLAANKNSNEKQKLEQQLAELIRNHHDILASYKGYSLVTLIIRSGSETVAKAAQDSIFKLPNYAMLDLLGFPAPDQESLRISAVKSGAEFIINLVQAMCLLANFDSILTSEFLSTLEHLVERENDPDAKLALQQGHALCNEIMRINSERQQLEDERKADKYIKCAIRNEELSPLVDYINYPANSNKIKPLLHFAIEYAKFKKSQTESDAIKFTWTSWYAF